MKQGETGSVTNFIARWRAPNFVCLQKFIQQELVCMGLNNSRHNLSTVLMSQTFEGFNDLWKMAHDMEIHLNKCKKCAKEVLELVFHLESPQLLRKGPHMP